MITQMMSCTVYGYNFPAIKLTMLPWFLSKDVDTMERKMGIFSIPALQISNIPISCEDVLYAIPNKQIQNKRFKDGYNMFQNDVYIRQSYKEVYAENDTLYSIELRKYDVYNVFWLRDWIPFSNYGLFLIWSTFQNMFCLIHYWNFKMDVTMISCYDSQDSISTFNRSIRFNFRAKIQNMR